MRTLGTQNQLVSETLKQSLADKKKKNPAYSARALARDLKVSPAFLSMVLSGEKHLSLARARQISDLLNMPARRKNHFLRAVAIMCLSGKSEAEEVRTVLFEPYSAQIFAELELDRSQFFCHWYNVALLDLSTCSDFSSDPEWISARLGITITEANESIGLLLRLGFLKRAGKSLTKAQSEIAFPTTTSHQAIRNIHSQMIDKAKEALESSSAEDFSLREISGITMAIDPAKAQEAKTRIAQFKREMYDLLATDEGAQLTEVYQLNIQLFPLTKTRIKGGPQ